MRALWPVCHNKRRRRNESGLWLQKFPGNWMTSKMRTPKAKRSATSRISTCWVTNCGLWLVGWNTWYQFGRLRGQSTDVCHWTITPVSFARVSIQGICSRGNRSDFLGHWCARSAKFSLNQNQTRPLDHLQNSKYFRVWGPHVARVWSGCTAVRATLAQALHGRKWPAASHWELSANFPARVRRPNQSCRSFQLQFQMCARWMGTWKGGTNTWTLVQCLGKRLENYLRQLPGSLLFVWAFVALWLAVLAHRSLLLCPRRLSHRHPGQAICRASQGTREAKRVGPSAQEERPENTCLFFWWPAAEDLSAVQACKHLGQLCSPLPWQPQPLQSAPAMLVTCAWQQWKKNIKQGMGAYIWVLWFCLPTLKQPLTPEIFCTDQTLAVCITVTTIVKAGGHFFRMAAKVLTGVFRRSRDWTEETPVFFTHWQNKLHELGARWMPASLFRSRRPMWQWCNADESTWISLMEPATYRKGALLLWPACWLNIMLRASTTRQHHFLWELRRRIQKDWFI